VTGAEPQQPFDPDLEAVDDGCFVERRADFRKRHIQRRLSIGPRRRGSTANALPVTLLARAL